MKQLRALLWFCLTPWVAWAARHPLILYESAVPQYRTTAISAHTLLPDAEQLDATAKDAVKRLEAASLVVAVGHRAFELAKESAGRTPVVFCVVLGVKRDVLNASVTGVPLEPDPKSVFGAMRALHPQARRVGMIYNPAQSELIIEPAQRAAKQLDMELVLKPVRAATEVTAAAEAIAKGIDWLWLPPDPKLYSKELFAFLLNFAAERKLPLFGFLDSFTQAGAMASVSPNYEEIGKTAGKLAADILAKPEGTRVPTPTFAPGNLTLNLGTARALGITVPPQPEGTVKQVFR